MHGARDQQAHMIRGPEESKFGTGTSLALIELTDAAEHPGTEWKLLESERCYRDLVDSLPQIVWTAEPDGYLDYYNQRWYDYTGLTGEDCLAIDGWKAVLHPDDAEHCVQRWYEAVENGRAYEIVCRFKRASDGCYRWHIGRALPERDAAGQIVKWFGTCTDIDDQKRAETDLAQALVVLRATVEQLRRENKVQDDFVSIISHEFRTTLTGIQGFSELMRDEEFSFQEIREYAADINIDARRLTRLINELLDLNRMKSGKMAFNSEQVDLNAIIGDVVDRIRPSTTNHSFRLRLDETLPCVSGDRDKLIQVVTNLISNAVKYSPAGGEILLSSEVESQVLHVRVQDQGMGIPVDALEHVFENYSRIESEANKFVQGTGLGLPIVRQIIQMHGGRTWAESVLGKGSIFHFTLPVSHKLAPI